MIFKINQTEDDFLENSYKDSMKSLNEFYEIDWVHHLPNIIVVDDRKTINALKGEETENWVVAWADGMNTVYILNKENLEKESNHKYSPEKYSALIKHELSHLFYKALNSGQYKPIWLNEGMAIYTSGQNIYHKKLTAFNKFLEFYDHGGKGVYDEPGFFVEGVVNKFGKQKLLNFIKEQSKLKTKGELEQLFAETYGFNLNYTEINKQDFLK